MQIFVSSVTLIVGFILLVKGADWFVEGASDIAKKFKVSTLVIGLTVVAMGTSLPEAAISISAAAKGSAGIAIGNILGSNIMNVALILGITGLITPLAVQRTTRRYELPIVIFITAVMAIFGLRDEVISQLEGMVLTAFFIAYLIYTFKVAASNSPKGELECCDSGREEAASESEEPPKSIVKILLITILGAVAIVLGANLTVDGASELARLFGMSERVIGLTIVAFGTSLPELVTCVAAALKKQADIAIGNIVGSNIFNILFVVGIASLIRPIGYDREFISDSVVALIMPAILLLLVTSNKDKQLKRIGAGILLICYVTYFIIFNTSII